VDRLALSDGFAVVDGLYVSHLPNCREFTRSNRMLVVQNMGEYWERVRIASLPQAVRVNTVKTEWMDVRLAMNSLHLYPFHSSEPSTTFLLPPLPH
jgi:hypothetical protein